jgi:hypothetical protein
MTNTEELVKFKQYLSEYVPSQAVRDTNNRTKLIAAAKSLSHLMEYFINEEIHGWLDDTEMRVAKLEMEVLITFATKFKDLIGKE